VASYSNRRTRGVCSKMCSSFWLPFQNTVYWLIFLYKELYVLVRWQRKYMYTIELKAVFLHKFLYNTLIMKLSKCLRVIY